MARSTSPTAAPLLDAKYNAFIANGLSVENPAANIEPWLSQAQSSIASQLAAVNATNFTVNPSVTVSNNVAYVTGTAPVNVDTVWINGVAYPLTWTSLTNWTVTVPLTNGHKQFERRRRGQQRPADHRATATVSASIYNGTNASPVGQVVINEIMYDPRGRPTRSLSNCTTTPPTSPLICPAGSSRDCPTRFPADRSLRRRTIWCWRRTARPLRRLWRDQSGV